MSGRLQNRVAIVTGAGDGIGRAVARGFAAESARVLVDGRSHSNGAPWAPELPDGAEG